jgi:hypothetical protein
MQHLIIREELQTEMSSQKAQASFPALAMTNNCM